MRPIAETKLGKLKAGNFGVFTAERVGRDLHVKKGNLLVAVVNRLNVNIKSDDIDCFNELVKEFDLRPFEYNFNEVTLLAMMTYPFHIYNVPSLKGVFNCSTNASCYMYGKYRLFVKTLTNINHKHGYTDLCEYFTDPCMLINVYSEKVLRNLLKFNSELVAINIDGLNETFIKEFIEFANSEVVKKVILLENGVGGYEYNTDFTLAEMQNNAHGVNLADVVYSRFKLN